MSQGDRVSCSDSRERGEPDSKTIVTIVLLPCQQLGRGEIMASTISTPHLLSARSKIRGSAPMEGTQVVQKASCIHHKFQNEFTVVGKK